MSLSSGSKTASSVSTPQTLSGYLPERLFIALDYPDAASALAMAEKLAPLGVSFKVGLQLFYAAGLPVVHQLRQFNRPIFVDLKLHDIPNTVAGATAALVAQGVDFLNLHIQGGPEMMRAAVEAANTAAQANGQAAPKLFGVTYLTSLSEQHLREFHFVESASLSEYVQHLALHAKKCGLQGVVCSAQEAPVIREICGPDFLLITPGIRPADSETQDQSRVITPAQALQNGADYLVMGRPVTGATDPVGATQKILDEMQGALA
jgi:orotidine-5'-phosphate decarboxylase